jgi:hypothetical protein
MKEAIQILHGPFLLRWSLKKESMFAFPKEKWIKPGVNGGKGA